MENEFYNAFASPMTISQSTMLENETGTMQKPPKLMSIEEYSGWAERFENWVQAYYLDAWEHTESQYIRPVKDNGLKVEIRDLSVEEKKKYKDEKMMVSLLQQAIKEDILILLQHNGSAHSIWEELESKFLGSDEMIKNKKSLMKKEFDLFRGLRTENTKQIIERYCNLLKNMNRLNIKKDKDELIEKLADALPHDVWGTYLMMLKNKPDFDKLTLSEFVKQLEAQEMEQRKIARMKNYDGEQDIGLYYKGGVSDKTNIAPKTETAFNAKSSSESSSQGSRRIGNPMLTEEDYDQVDAEEMELMDIKWCLASMLRRVEKFKQITGRDDFRDANVSTLGFDKSKVTCFRCREKGQFKRECTNREASGAQNPFGNNDYYRKAIYHQVAQQPHQQQSSQTAHARKEIEDSKKACLVNQDDGSPSKGFNWDKYISADSKACLIDQDDERLPEGFSWDNYCLDKEFLAKAFVAQIVKDNGEKYTTDDYWAEKIRKRLNSVTKKDKNAEEDVRVIKKQDKEIPVFEIKKEAVAEKVSENCENCETMKKQNSELVTTLTG
ncbi:putative transcription factor interactor and regulator CCHC(Zn) family [Helianthus annuus]|nr:putative transcription factor interactor and regulator CCHC(Zn) family [Helianthus annuus]